MDHPKKEKSTSRYLPANWLTIDREYQREPIRSHYLHIAENLDLDALDIFHVSERHDGSLVIIDGQHRWMALHEQGVAEWGVECRVYEGLDRKREAELYRQLNRTRKPKPWDDFKAGLIQGDPECMNIRNAARAAGWEVNGQCRDGFVSCISTLREIYRRPGGVWHLQYALEDARGAWGTSHIGVEKSMLAGLALIHRTYSKEVDRHILKKKLAKAQGGPSGILGKARSLRDLHAKPIYRLCASVMLATYNRGRRKGQLDERV